MSNPQLDAAAALSQAQLDQGTGDAYDYAIVALARSGRGDFEGAELLFQHALKLEPGNAATLTGLAIHYRNCNRNRDAVLACDEAIRNSPEYPDAWLERGAILGSGGSSEAAKASFKRAAELAPHLAAAHAGLASLAAREGSVEAARTYAANALSIDPTNAVAINALASAALRSGELEQALALLTPQIARLSEPSLERSLANSLAADAYHGLNDSKAAFRHYVLANSDFQTIHAGAASDQFDQTAFIQALYQGLAKSEAADWVDSSGNQPHNAAQRHIFLIGYPRSGTTLVENVLASLPGVSALEERPTFTATDREYISGDEASVIQGIADFSRADTARLEQHRQAYWDKVTASGIEAKAACFVDMDPLKATRLPFIARLFPESRILVMRRDPRDVVWSCFRTNFAMSSGTLEYTTLERAARHYDALMRFTELAFERLPVDQHIIRYDQLVRDFDTETKAMCRFAGLEWTDAVRSFDRTAIRRGVTTASVGQVNRGLYDGTRQWQRYAEYLAPVLPILQPWIEKFGYD